MEEIEKIYNLCFEFHALIEKVDLTKLFIKMHRFPNGSCGDTSLLLGVHLKKHGYSTNYVCGTKIDGDEPHAWLEYKDIIIDITAYQFPEIQEKVIVTNKSKWHNNFEVDANDIHNSDIDEYDEVTKAMIKENYKIIIEASTKNIN